MARYEDYFEMMSDRRRLDFYRRAIREKVKKGDVVADLGTGLGILSFFALQAGASHVYAVERKTSIYLAQKIAALNGWRDRISFVRGDSMKIELPEPVDCLISETLGSFGIDENTVPAIIDFRKRFLKPGGGMIPLGVSTYLSPVSNRLFHEKRSVWREIEGVDFSPADEELKNRSFICSVSAEELLAAPQVFQTVDLLREERVDFEKELKFTFSESGTLTGFAGWFDVDLTKNIKLSTSPDSPRTHWHQAFFSVEEPVEVRAGESVDIYLRMEPAKDESDETDLSYAIRYQGRLIN